MPNTATARIIAQDLSFSYPHTDTRLLEGLSFSIYDGQYIALLGANGSGKSTLLRLLTGILEADSGTLRIKDESGVYLNPSDEQQRLAARRCVSTVMQNPDEQIVASIVAEDVAWGPENLCLDDEEVHARVAEALRLCGLTDKAERSVQFLSGGEKQRLALASALAMQSPVLVLDEALSMIDPSGREEFMRLLDSLHTQGQRTIIHVTHSLDEALRADRVLVLHKGRLAFDGSPAALLALDSLQDYAIAPSQAVQALQLLSSTVPGFSPPGLEPEAFADALLPLLNSRGLPDPSPASVQDEAARSEAAEVPVAGEALEAAAAAAAAVPAAHTALCFVHSSHEYLSGTALAGRGIQDISLEVPSSSSLALIGPTGCGKSTLLRHGNAILLASHGHVEVLGRDPRDTRCKLEELRMQASLAVQNPESAFFKPFLADDIAWGPRNKGLTGKPLLTSVRGAMARVGLDWKSYRDRNPRSLSGGESRRAALAAVLAMESPLLLLDEPTAALDGLGQQQIHAIVQQALEAGKTVVASTHSMEEAAAFNQIAVLKEGRLLACAPPREVFGPLWREDWGLRLPWTVAVARCLAAKGIPFSTVPLTLEELFAGLGLPAKASDAVASAGAQQLHRQPLAAQTLQAAGSEAPLSPPLKGKIRYRKSTGIEFFRNGNLGQYISGRGLLFRMSPLLKAGIFGALFVLLLMSQELWQAAATLGALLLGAKLFASLSPLHLLRPLKPSIPLFVLIILLQLIFPRAGDSSMILFSLGQHVIRLGAIEQALFLILRIIAFMALLSLYADTTHMDRLPRKIARFLSPFGGAGRIVGLFLGILFRFVPVLVEEAERITIAQLSRGASYSGKGRLRSAVALIVPLLLRSLERSERLALAMELRLFSGGCVRRRKGA